VSEIEARFRVSVYGTEELKAFADKSTTAIKGFARSASQDLNAAAGEIGRFAERSVRSLAMIGGAGAGLAVGAQTNRIIELRDQVQGLAATANLADSQIANLRKTIFETAKVSNQFGTDVAAGLQAFVAKTGDFEAARKNIELYARAATAARSSVSDLANVGAELPKLGITGDQTSSLAIMMKQADVGAVELKDLVSQGPRQLAAFQTAGLARASRACAKAAPWRRCFRRAQATSSALQRRLNPRFATSPSASTRSRAPGSRCRVATACRC
jgi:hypothetical protein